MIATDKLLLGFILKTVTVDFFLLIKKGWDTKYRIYDAYTHLPYKYRELK